MSVPVLVEPELVVLPEVVVPEVLDVDVEVELFAKHSPSAKRLKIKHWVRQNFFKRK